MAAALLSTIFQAYCFCSSLAAWQATGSRTPSSANVESLPNDRLSMAFPVRCKESRHRMGARLYVDVDQVERRVGRFQHAPAFDPIVGALHLVERNGRRLADHEAALAQIVDRQRADLGVALFMIVDEVVQI